ncbi:MAG: hypothetical protein ACR2GQ_04590 [Gemmatimonadota bacterium]
MIFDGGVPLKKDGEIVGASGFPAGWPTPKITRWPKPAPRRCNAAL